jgi:hypothetical protein
MRSRQLRLAAVALAAGLAALPFPSVRSLAAQPPLPASLTDQEFWQLVDEDSEANGFFDSDNLLSNETTFQYVIPRLKTLTKPGGAYLGVGPEQNFTYIIALEPKIAFITDIRRGNLQEHLMYKALIEMAADRAEFLSLLFSRKRPVGLGADATPDQLLAAYEQSPPVQTLYDANLRAMRSWLTSRHHFTLQPDDLPGVEYVYSNFYASGPSLSYKSSRGQRTRYPTYSELQRETDGEGHPRGYLATEANFKWLKRFEENNLVVPLVGDFAGTKALRAVGTYLKAHNATVTAFYTSNVENYLFQSRVWNQFAANVATLPLDDSSTFVRACFDSCFGTPGSRSTTLLDSMKGLLKDFSDGNIRSYFDVLAHGR